MSEEEVCACCGVVLDPEVEGTYCDQCGDFLCLTCAEEREDGGYMCPTCHAENEG